MSDKNDAGLRPKGHLFPTGRCKSKKGYAWLVWALAAISFGYAFFHRVAPSVMVSDLMAEFAIGGAMLGTLSALYFYPYVLLQIPLGALLETVGTRILLTCALGLAAAGSFLFGLAAQIELAYLGRILIGVGCSVGFLGSLALARRWFPVHQFGFLAGLSMFVAMTSGMIAQAPLAYFVDEFGWRSSLFLLGGVGFGLAVLVFGLVRNTPASQPQISSTGFDKEAFFLSMRRAASHREVWKISFVALTLSGPMLTLGGLWGTPYLIVAYDLARPHAAFLMSLLLFGWALGAPATGWLSDRLGRRKPILIAGSVIVCLMLFLLIFIPYLPLSAAVAIVIIIGFSGGSMATCFALVRDVLPDRVTGAATGIVNALTVASGAVLQPVVGLLLDLQTADNTAAYTEAVFRQAFCAILVTTFAGLLVAFRLREK